MPPKPKAQAAQAPSSAPEPRQDWNTGLFDCFAAPGGTPQCLKSFFCPCMVYADIVQDLDEEEAPFAGNWTGAATHFFVLSIPTMLGAMVGLPIIPPFTCCNHSAVRQAIRNRYNLKETGVCDCCVVFWCSGCSLAQEYNEFNGRRQEAALTSVSVNSMPV